MVPIDRNRERLVSLFVLGVVVLLPPVLLVFNRPVRVLGIPLLYLHIFLAWIILIAATARIVRRLPSDDGTRAAESEPPAAGDGRAGDA